MTSDVYVALYIATTLWHTIGLIWVVMGCYGRKSEFADENIAYHLIYSIYLSQNLSSHLRFRHVPSLRHSEQPHIAAQSFRTFALSHFPLPFALWCALCLGSSKAEISSFHRLRRHPFVTSTLRHLSLSLRTLKPLHTFPLFCAFAHFPFVLLLCVHLAILCAQLVTLSTLTSHYTCLPVRTGETPSNSHSHPVGNVYSPRQAHHRLAVSHFFRNSITD